MVLNSVQKMFSELRARENMSTILRLIALPWLQTQRLLKLASISSDLCVMCFPWFVVL
jgi:predicted DNA-binding ribbon-helix-helix protein